MRAIGRFLCWLLGHGWHYGRWHRDEETMAMKRYRVCLRCCWRHCESRTPATVWQFDHRIEG